MKISIVGTLHESSEKFFQMKAIYDACEAAEVEVPAEVFHFFDEESPPDYPSDEIDLEDAEFVKVFKTGESGGGFVINLEELANMYDESEIKFLRFTAKE